MYSTGSAACEPVNGNSPEAVSEMPTFPLLGTQGADTNESQTTIKWLLRYWNTLKYVSPETLARRLYRRAATLYALKRGLIAKSPKTNCDVRGAAERLLDQNFLAAARKQHQIVKSAFALEQSTGRLILWKTGEVIDEEFIQRTDWNHPGRIPPSEVDTCYFAVFGEQAVLVDRSRVKESLSYLAHYIDLLRKHTLPNASFLTIPWCTYSVARRLCNLLFGLSLVAESHPDIAKDPNFFSLLCECRKLSRLLNMLREDDLGYNHLATETFAQCIAAHVFDGESTRNTRLEQFLDALQRQVGTDGLQLERSATYQAHVLSHLDVLLAAQFFGEAVGEQAAELADTMRYALGVLTHPDGEIALFNDCAIGIGPSPECLGISASIHEQPLELLSETGFYRLNGGSFAVICDIGNCGPDEMPAHSHADYLSIEASYGEQRFISDPGVATTKAGAERAWTRSSQVHNGPTFCSLEPMDAWAAFRVGRRGHAFRLETAQLDAFAPVWVAGWQNGFEHKGGRVARWVGLWPDQMLSIVDIWIGCEQLEAASSFLIWHGLECKKTRDGVEVMSGADRLLRVKAVQGNLGIGKMRQFPFGSGRPKQAYYIAGRPCWTKGFRTLAVSWSKPEFGEEPGFNSELAQSVGGILFEQVNRRASPRAH
jgi:hypothetical protein